MNRLVSKFRQVGILSALVLFAGCASKPEIVPSSGKRLPTPPSDVMIYDKQPAKYEQLGIVTNDFPHIVCQQW